MCKGNYIFNVGDIVRRKPAMRGGFWAADYPYTKDGAFVITAIDSEDRLSFGTSDTWEAANFDLVCRAPLQPPTPPRPSVPLTSAPYNAITILEKAAGHMRDRAALRDAPDGERSMAKTVAMFNIYAGTELTEEQGWRFMEILKIVRSSQGAYCADDHEDATAYAALCGEAAAQANNK